jgi:hypothetical protein
MGVSHGLSVSCCTDMPKRPKDLVNLTPRSRFQMIFVVELVLEITRLYWSFAKGSFSRMKTWPKKQLEPLGRPSSTVQLNLMVWKRNGSWR